MKLSTGTRLGAYEIVEPLGSGGMGDVYRAHDTKLKRDVAIKVLPDEFSRDSERIARFQREAEVLATLNHPNIAAIYDFREFGESRCLVLELVEGETLADRLAAGPLPIDDALNIAKQIAGALEGAHEKGVVHRDLKPANIKITPDGKVKVLDFGLAKIREMEYSRSGLANSPTQLTAASSTGMMLGTAAYMSPEQVKGRVADRTSDVWAFGCLLYEMLTGRPSFGSETLGELVASILKEEPDWRSLPAETPEGIRRLLHRCLQKDRNLRFHDMADVRIEIEDAQNAPAAVSRLQTQPSRRSTLILISALALATAVAIVLGFLAFRPRSGSPELRLEITTPPSQDPAAVAVSSDGQQIVFVADDEGRSRLWLRSLASSSAKPLAKTDGAADPFWSPDGSSIGFFAEGKLKRIDLGNGLVQTLSTVPNGGVLGGTWNSDSLILYGQTAGPIMRISANGGTPVEVTRLTAGQAAHRTPRFLPDGKTFLFSVLNSEGRGIHVGRLDSAMTQRLLDAGNAEYLSPSKLLFVREGTLFAQDFDPDAMKLAGSPELVAERVVGQSLSVSGKGTIVYRTTSPNAQPRRQFVWFDRSGKELSKVGEPLNVQDPAMSPDGRRVAVSRISEAGRHIWILDLGQEFFSRFTFRTATETIPVWCGSQIIFGGDGGSSPYDLYEKSIAGAGSETLLLDRPGSQVPTDCSADGRVLLYRENDPRTGYDVWALPMDGKRNPVPVAQTAADERDAQFSADGKWIAYQSDESGRFEIYVQPFPGTGGKFQISTGGGEQVRWRRDGKEMFYTAPDGRLMAVPIRFTSNGQSIEAGEPMPLFMTRVGGRLNVPSVQQYAVATDGQRFLMNTDATDETSISPISLILNWARK
jgi:eukaryotic-like serine/threonine-protein kinase